MLPPHDWTWVDNDEALQRMLDRLVTHPCIALDTESNSMHAYEERICLVQVSIPGADFLIDPLAVDIGPLGGVLADARYQKVFHGADYDIVALKRAYGFEVHGLFDTMLAAKVLGWPRFGLAALLAEHFGHRANKRFQTYNWGRRPVDVGALEYARYDTHYLLALRDLQWAELQQCERLDECLHVCRRQTRVEPRPRVFDPDGFWAIKGARELDEPGRRTLQALYLWREQLGRHRDRPPAMMVNDRTLVALAIRRPEGREALTAFHGLGRPFIQREGGALLRTIVAAQHTELPTPPPKQTGPSKAIVERYETLRVWRRMVAAERGVEPEIIMAKQTLMELAEANPRSRGELETIESLDPWELERYGEGLLEALGQFPRTKYPV